MKCYILTYDFMNKNNIARTYYRFFYDKSIAMKTFQKISNKPGCVEISLKECRLTDERVFWNLPKCAMKIIKES